VNRTDEGIPNRKPKRWLRRTLWSLLAIIGVVCIAALGIYLYIRSISLDEIKDRQASIGMKDEASAEGEALPVVLEGQVSKAEDLVGKPIATQDALDVAAILLNSGLSMREILFLQGNATYDLSTEEKQRIRDLLLEKLTTEEIELLRGITVKYGKGLVILDPDYPIEWVGMRDQEKLEQLKREYNEKQAAHADEMQDGAQDKLQNGLPIVRGVDKGSEESKESTDTSTGQGQLSPEQEQEKQRIDEQYNARMQKLRATCKASSDAILQDIVGYLSNSGDASLDKLQSEYLGKVTEAEAGCDSEFQSLLQDAKDAYASAELDLAIMPTWQAEYDKAKSSVRSAAIVKIAAQLKKDE
jgi:hypothetical protein